MIDTFEGCGHPAVVVVRANPALQAEHGDHSFPLPPPDANAVPGLDDLIAQLEANDRQLRLRRDEVNTAKVTVDLRFGEGGGISQVFHVIDEAIAMNSGLGWALRTLRAHGPERIKTGVKISVKHGGQWRPVDTAIVKLKASLKALTALKEAGVRGIAASVDVRIAVGEEIRERTPDADPPPPLETVRIAPRGE
jgi:hypothetical protein